MSTTTVAVADFGVGNLHSVVGALNRVAPRAKTILAQDAATLARADKIILPGDGNFDACMRAIDKRGLREVLMETAKTKPFWGVCAGMQMLYAGSDEGELPGLGIFEGRICKLPSSEGLKIPHMGWNGARMVTPEHPVLSGVEDGARFYFVHSYYAEPCADTVAVASHGVDITAMSSRGGIFATQFHPEKSAEAGERLLKNFMAL